MYNNLLFKQFIYDHKQTETIYSKAKKQIKSISFPLLCGKCKAGNEKPKHETL